MSGPYQPPGGPPPPPGPPQPAYPQFPGSAPAGPYPQYGQGYPAQPYPAGGYPGYGSPQAARRRRSAFLTIAQVIAIIQSLLVVLVGIVVAIGGNSINDYFVNQGVSTQGGGMTFTAFGVGFMILGFLFLLAAIMLGRASHVARVVVVIFEALVIIGSLLSFVQSLAPVASIRPRLNSSVIVALVDLILGVLVIYGLTIDPHTRRVFSRAP